MDAAVLASVWPSTTIGLSVTNSANFSQGETGAIYTVTVSTAARPSNGVVTLTDNLPTGLAMSSMAGTGWTCSTTSSSGSCTSNAALSTNTTYLITVTVNVAANSPFSVTNTVSLTGGGSLGASAQDVTTVTLPAQTITFGSLPPKLIGPPAFTVSATASSGLQVSFMSLRRSVCTVSGSTVMLVALGTCTIQASQGGDSDYAPAPNVDQSFLVVSLCDFTQAGSVGAADVQSVINAALGTATPSYDLNGDGMVNVLDVQIEIEAAIGRGCFATN